MSWKNLNFRGMGEQLHACITKKEDTEGGKMLFDPTFSLKWVDNTIGKTSRLSISHSADTVLEAFRNILTLGTQQALIARGATDLQFPRLDVRNSATRLKFEE